MKPHFFYPFTLFFKVLWNNIIIFRNAAIELIAVKFLFPVAGLIQKKSPGALNPDKLFLLPPQSFGHALGKHMQFYKLDFIPGFEEHDMKHLLLGYPLTVPGEIRLSAFEFGTGSRSFMTLGVFLFGIPLAVDQWSKMWQDYRQGRKYRSFRKLQLKSMLYYDFDLMLKITPKCPELCINSEQHR